MSTENSSGTRGEMNESLNSQIARLAEFIVVEVPGEPSQSEGAVDCAIRIIHELRAKAAETLRRLYGAAALLCEERRHADRRPCGWCLANTGYNSVSNAADNVGQTLLDEPAALRAKCTEMALALKEIERDFCLCAQTPYVYPVAKLCTLHARVNLALEDNPGQALLDRLETVEEQLRLANIDAINQEARANDAEARNEKLERGLREIAELSYTRSDEPFAEHQELAVKALTAGNEATKPDVADEEGK